MSGLSYPLAEGSGDRLQLWTQPFWAVLFITPFWFVFAEEPKLLSEWSEFAGREEGGARFDFLLFGAATGVLFSLVAQVGEQVDYLRFLPDRTRRNRWHWWVALICAGPGWILLGGARYWPAACLPTSWCATTAALPTRWSRYGCTSRPTSSCSTTPPSSSSSPPSS